jgi:hypothetical protein
MSDAQSRYEAAYHAMQAGVAMEMNYPDRQAATEPKHLRVGINTAMCDHAALVKLLIDRGLFTEEQYIAACADMMEAEKARYEQRLSERLGTTVTLA